MRWWWGMDGVLLDRLEAGCHKFQRLTGRTNFWLGAVGAWIIVYCNLIMAMSYFLPELPKWIVYLGVPKVSSAAAMWACGFGVVIWIMDGTFFYHDRERKALARIERGLANPSKIFLPAMLWRWMLLWMIVWAFFLRAVFLPFVIMALVYWLQCCDPLPPQKSKVREWIESWSARLVPVRQER